MPNDQVILNDPREYAQIPQKVKNQMRHRALAESYYMAKTVLGYDKLNPRTHGPLCTFLDTCKTFRRLIQMPRSHFKTTICTVSHRIQTTLRDPWKRTLIVGDTAENAEKHHMKILRHFESNNLLRWLFADLLWEDPNAQAKMWSKKESQLPEGLKTHGEATFDAIGAGGGVVSRHYDIINPDDLISDDEYYSETEMARVIEWSTGLESLFVPPVDQGQMDIPSTFWRVNDVYAYLEQYFGEGKEAIPTGPYSYLKGTIAVFRRGALENGEPIFPEAVSKEFLHRLQERNPERYAAQYANNPYESGVAYFRKEYLHYYHWVVPDHLLAMPKEGFVPEKVSLQSLFIVSLCDPHAGGTNRFGSTRAAVLTVGIHTPTNKIFILDTWIKRAPTDQMISEIIRQNEKWQPQIFSIEANGLQKMIKPWLEERIRVEHRQDVPYRPFIPKGDKDGERRIKGLQPLFRAGQVWLQNGMTEFIEEYLAWPRGTKDAMDCFSQILEFISGYDQVTDQEMTEYEDAILAGRSHVTGY